MVAIFPAPFSIFAFPISRLRFSPNGPDSVAWEAEGMKQAHGGSMVAISFSSSESEPVPHLGEPGRDFAIFSARYSYHSGADLNARAAGGVLKSHVPVCKIVRAWEKATLTARATQFVESRTPTAVER